MYPSFPNRLPHSPIYRKAQEIFTLSRHISNYLTDDLAVLREDGNEDPNIYFGGDIVQQSVSLAPQILKAESEPYAEQKHKHAASVTRLVNRIHKNCERLERANTNGKDFLPILRGEIKKFRKLQRRWMLTF
ncbi:hypothetical protein J1N09_05345 [Aureitalea sp. L0-47]|uniref:hypothetical protein n=1 Tax=Aureitalea sp. L0-47 TaxID=2816962 RepID=UPI002237AA65|nr:hypothetical protein [Aureitalea sp. L0-47]MCW5519253.1 hypothetical protein [Aureitalea sp. L0-47]